jgi:hypothetical protein
MADSDDEGLSAPIYDSAPAPSATTQAGPEYAIQFIGEDAPAAAAAPPPTLAPPQQKRQQQPPPQQRVQQIQIDPATIKTWTTIYPRYLEEGLTTAQGRRLSKANLAGCAWHPA